MAYNWKKILENALKIAEKGGVTTTDEVIDLLPCAKSAFYEHFPSNSEEMERIREKIAISKSKTKISIRRKLFESTNPTALLSLYKMICTDEERNAIMMTRTDVTTNGKDIVNEPLVLRVIHNKEELEEFKNETNSDNSDI